ncbi:aliphatic sulfonate ABC transporter substrate-binding protein [Frankia nepalensis]|uniref:aliphatic sulfonate ABC transporter substrate-binding protein n=1 Tax=Frankia nepalensis TaxID=1836974 RepID=UPI0027DCA67C|nr:aliphatic sulfonate ABC transporter substrate-binding protein [Frankia nepalensis]
MLIAVAGLAACGSGGDDGTPAPSAAAVTGYPTAVPAGTKLRVGDQGDTLRGPIELSGQGTDLPYSVDWSTFAAGPLLLEAFRAKAVDIGFVADTPPVLAAASGQDLAVVASWKSSGDQMTLVTRPGSDIDDLADLKGKKVAYSTGTILQAFALRALDSVGLGQRDVEQVNLLPTDIGSALSRGDADAGVLVEPLASPYLKDNPTARLVVSGGSVAPFVQYLITTRDVLDDPAKAAAIGDFVKRWVRGLTWRDTHVDEFVQKQYVEKQNQPAEIGKLLLTKQGVATFTPIDGSVVEGAQKLADLFKDSGVIPKKLDMSKLFDTRYNSAVEEATK